MASWLDQIYQTELGRTPDAEGRKFYQNLYDAGRISPEEIAADISGSPEGLSFDPAGKVSWGGGNGAGTNTGGGGGFNMSQVNDSLSSGFATIVSGLGNPAQADAMATGFAGMRDNFDATRGQIGEGFARTSEEMGQGFQQTQQMLGQGFSDVQQGQGATQDLMVQGFAGTNENMFSGFDGLNENLTTGFDANQESIGNAQTAVLDGQQEMSGFMSDMNTNMTNQYSDLSQQNMDTQDRIAGFSSNFDDYVDQYGQDTARAESERRDIQDGLVSGITNVRQDVASVANVQDQQMVGTDVARRERFAQFVQQTPPQAIVAGRNSARTFAQDPTISPQIRSQMNIMGTAFDDTGNLIMSAQDPAGNTITRAIDDLGNLMIRVFDPMGQIAGQNSVNLPEAFQMLSTLQQRQQTVM